MLKNFLIIKGKYLFMTIAVILLVTILGITIVMAKASTPLFFSWDKQNSEDFIKWVDFNPTYEAMLKAMSFDIKSHNTEGGVQHNWIDLLAYLGAKYGGNFKKYKAKDMDTLVKNLEMGDTIEALTEKMKYFDYYKEAYSAVLGGFIGNFSIQVQNDDGTLSWQDKYGMKVFSPIASRIPLFQLR